MVARRAGRILIGIKPHRDGARGFAAREALKPYSGKAAGLRF